VNPHFREFLNLDWQIPDSVCYFPIKLAELGGLNFGGRDFVYLEKEGVMFVAESDMNITSRVDAYLTNVNWVDEPIVEFALGEQERELRCGGSSSCLQSRQ